MTRHQEVYNEDYALSVRAHRCNSRVSMFVLLVLVDVICVMLVVLIARVDIHAVSTQFS